MDPFGSVASVIQLASVTSEIIRFLTQSLRASLEMRDINYKASNIKVVLESVSKDLIELAGPGPSHQSKPAPHMEALNSVQELSHDLECMFQDPRLFESHIAMDRSTRALPACPCEKKPYSGCQNVSMHGKLEIDEEMRKELDDSRLRESHKRWKWARRGDTGASIRSKEAKLLRLRCQVVSLLAHLTANSSAIVLSSFVRNSALTLSAIESSSNRSTAAPHSSASDTGSLVCQIFELARHPNTAAFVVGCCVFSASTITYQRLHNNERYQAHCIFAALVIALVVGTALGNEFILSFFPWAIIIGLSTSTLLENCILCHHRNVATIELA